jgi:phospholipid/cholesterol/gamma-HCH transport system permease protein
MARRVEVVTDPDLPDRLVIVLRGKWKQEDGPAEAAAVEAEIGRHRNARSMLFRTSGLETWDTGLVLFVMKVRRLASRLGIDMVDDGLPQGVRQILAAAAPAETDQAGRNERHGKGADGERAGRWPDLGRVRQSVRETLSFVGEVALAFARLATGRSRLRAPDLFLVMEQAGIRALPIVSLISLLVGLIFAFVGAIQLKLFGAQIYVADLVGIAMARAMGAVMTGIIMAGRTGASFAAQIGTMQTNEEIDALTTTGISPIDFLVLPRVLGLAIMMPLLTLYADFMGFLGGLLVGVSLLGFDASQYYHETKIAVGLTNVWIGVFMGLVFGVLVGIAGCLRGMQCGRTALAVGEATTSAVVTSIVGIIAATAVITVLLNILGL